MKRLLSVSLAFAAVVSLSWLATAQQPGGRGQGGRGPGGPEGQGGPPNPIAEAIDVDRDHELSSREIEGATAALKKLDRNGDGKVTRDELRPEGGRGPGGRGGEPGGRPDQPGGRGGEPGGRGGEPGGRGEGRSTGRSSGASEFLERLQSFDKNKDGKVTKSELPSRMQSIVDRHDANDDGALDKDELSKFADQLAAGRNSSGRGQRDDGPQGRGQDGPPPQGGPGGRGPGGEGPGGRGPQGGGPDPARMVEHAFEYDADNDGKLSRAELQKFAEEMVRRGPPGGGPGGQGGGRGQGGPPPGGGRGGERGQQGGGRGGDRPSRPAVE